MATAAQSLAKPTSPFPWIKQFLKEELKPYPGRAELVGRMVLAATIVMVVCLTFQISYAFQGAIFALLLSRENPRATLNSAGILFLFSGVGAGYVLFSARLVISYPTAHLLWVIFTFFVAFYLLSAMTNYGASSAFAIVISVGVPLWDRYVSAETNVEDTLRVLLSAAIGLATTVAVELAFASQKPGDNVAVPVAERLATVEKLLREYAEGRATDEATSAEITRLGMVGSSRLRRLLRRSNYSPAYIERMGAVVALTGGIVDVAANLPTSGVQLSEEDRKRVQNLAANIAAIRTALLALQSGKIPRLVESPPEGGGGSTAPFLAEMERTVSLIAEVLRGAHPYGVDTTISASDDPPQRLFARDALANVAHLKFALKGCLTASACYVIYNAIDWPGISTCVTTCLLTALSTIGSSRQKQVLRITGAIVGGFVFAMGAQIFILPHVDSVGGFTIIFVMVTATAAWFMTGSSRVSYFGLQLALAYYLVHLQEFAFQSSLSITRDRVVGVLFGLIMMWFIFDQLWGAPAIEEMKKSFTSGVRLVAQLTREPVSTDLKIEMDRYYSLRETINTNFDSVRAFADGVLLEFRDTRHQDLAWRSRIIQWQPQLRAIFLAEAALWKYRAQLRGFELPEAMRTAERESSSEAATMLEGIADRMEGKTEAKETELEKSFERLSGTIEAFRLEQPSQELAPHIETFLSLTRSVVSLTTHLNAEI
ncbi:MAG TPA: FUSC family protein [Verrucomicrobiae bacterium]|nr:FUSC family protein [Verrucomicrobiae bacterium]